MSKINRDKASQPATSETARTLRRAVAGAGAVKTLSVKVTSQPWQPAAGGADKGTVGEKPALGETPLSGETLKAFVTGVLGPEVATERLQRLEALRASLGTSSTIVPLPVVVTTEQGSFTVPLFRVRGEKGERYFDDSGRTYDTFAQWKSSNVLPAGKMTYPVNGALSVDAAGQPRTESGNTPLTVDTLLERARDFGDTAALVGGLVVGAAAIIGTGGVATPLVAAAAATLAGYGAGRGASTLIDRQVHSESMSLANSEARSAWLGFAAGSAGLGALGAAAKVASSVARTGVPASHVAATRAAQGMVVAQAAGDASLINAGNELWQHRDEVGAREVLELAAQAALWGGFAARAGGPKKMYSVRGYRENLLNVRPEQGTPVNAERQAAFNKGVETLRAQLADAQGKYISPLKPGYQPAVEEAAIADALKGAKNHWSALHGFSTPELFARAQKVQARINPADSALASRNTVELYDNIARAVVEQSALGRSLQSRLPPRLKDLYWNYADRMGTPDDATAGNFNDFKPALEHLGTQKGASHVLSKDLWKRAGQPGFLKELKDTLTGRSPLEGAHMPGVAFAPVYDSPMLDVGYDAKSYQVRPSLGGEAGFKKTVEQLYQPRRLDQAVNAANGRDTEAPLLMLDFLGGHVSEQHAQFQAMLSGDKEARKYFNVLPPKTKVVGYENTDGPRVLLQPDGMGTLSAWRIFAHATRSNFRVDYIPVRDAAEAAKVAPQSVVKLSHVQKQLAPFKKEKGTTDLEALRQWRMHESWDTRYQYVEVDGVLKEIVPTYHWFYDFQPSLNHRSTEVQRMMYGFLADGVNKGASVFRADAAPHWGFQLAEAGQKIDLSKLDSHLALQENYKFFLMHVSPKAMLIPEVASAIKEASSYYGERIEGPSGRTTTSMADALLDFDSHRAFWESMLDERKGPVLKHERELNALKLNPREKQLLRFMDHHDEIITSDYANRAEVEKQLWDAGLLPFNGRGAGGRKTDALQGNPKRIAVSEMLKRAFPGATFSYYGALEGATNDPAFMMQMKDLRQDIGATLGRPVSDEAALDARDLARGNLSRGKLKQARVSGYEPFTLVRALNKLAESRPSIRGDAVAEIHNADESVLTLARKSAAGNDSPHLWVMNLSGKTKTVKLSLAELKRELGWQSVTEKSLEDILFREIKGSARRPSLKVKGDEVELTVEPYDYMILERR